MDFQAVADGIASAIGTVTATTTFGTEQATATSALPNQVTGSALLVYPPTGTMLLQMGRYIDTYDFALKLLRDPVDMPTRIAWLYAWATALRPIIARHFTLGISGVTEATAVDMRVAIDGERYASLLNTIGGDAFDVVDITIRVEVFELATGVAP